MAPNLVTRYFGGKAEMFAAATTVDLQVPAVLPGPLSELGARIARGVVERWEAADSADPLLMMLRSAGSSPTVAEALGTFFATQASQPAGRAPHRRPRLHARGRLGAGDVGGRADHGRRDRPVRHDAEPPCPRRPRLADRVAGRPAAAGARRPAGPAAAAAVPEAGRREPLLGSRHTPMVGRALRGRGSASGGGPRLPAIERRNHGCNGTTSGLPRGCGDAAPSWSEPPRSRLRRPPRPRSAPPSSRQPRPTPLVASWRSRQARPSARATGWSSRSASGTAVGRDRQRASPTRAGNTYTELTALHRLRRHRDERLDARRSPPAAAPSPTDHRDGHLGSADIGVAALEYAGLSTAADAGVVDVQATPTGTTARRRDRRLRRHRQPTTAPTRSRSASTPTPVSATTLTAGSGFTARLEHVAAPATWSCSSRTSSRRRSARRRTPASAPARNTDWLDGHGRASRPPRPAPRRPLPGAPTGVTADRRQRLARR